MPGITLIEARKRTNYPLANLILQSSSETDNFYQFIGFQSVYGGADTETYLRRKGKVAGKWRNPGEIISDYDNPLFSRVTAQLREMVNRTSTKTYVQANMGNFEDPRQLNRIELLKDMARDVMRAAIQGKYTDTATIRPGGGINSAVLLTGPIVPGPFYVDSMGPGLLNFDAPSGKLAFRAPGDAEYGEGVVIANGQPVTLFSDNNAYYITLTVNTVPVASGHSEVLFSSSTKQPDGLISLCDPSQQIQAVGPNGDAMSFEILDQLLEKMDKFAVEGEVAFVMHTRQFRALKTRGRGLGGAKIEDKMFGTMRIPHYEGIWPILTTKYLPDVPIGTSPTSHSVFSVNMNPDKGFFGLAAGDASGIGLQNAQVPDGSPVMGFTIRDLGMARDYNGMEEMVVWNGCFGMRAVQGVAQYLGVFDP